MGFFEKINGSFVNAVSTTSAVKALIPVMGNEVRNSKTDSEVKNDKQSVSRITKERKSTDSISRVVISSDCVTCGACSMMTKYIKENPDGTVAPNGAGIVPGEELEAFQGVIDACPVKAICLEKAGLVHKAGKEGLMELKQLIESEFNNYKIPLPKPESYKFIKSNYHVPTSWGSREFHYDYKSYNKAEDAGLQEFDRIMYSQRRALIQQILVQYKTNVLAQFVEYIKEAGNYYYDINTAVSSRLQEFAAEAQALSNGKITLPPDFVICDFEPVFGRPGSKFDREANVYQIKHLEEIWVTDSIMKELEPLSWFKTYVNVGDTTVYDGKRDKDMYSYDLREVISELEKWILNETEFVLNSWDGMKTIFESNLPYVLKETENGINSKIQALVQAIDNVIINNTWE